MPTTTTKPTPAPLGIPEGSVRAILALVLVVGALAIALTAIITDRASVPEAVTVFVAIAGPATALYFGQYVSPPGA